MTRRWVLSLGAAAASMALLPVADAASARLPAAVPVPVLTAPPAGLRGYPLWDSYHDLAPFGYEEAEYLVSGTATDAGGGSAAYTTRIIVSRPTDPARFNGTVLVDWVNVSTQIEVASRGALPATGAAPAAAVGLALAATALAVRRAAAGSR